MTVSTKPAAASEALLEAVHNTLRAEIEAMRAASEAKYGCPLQITNITLVPVAQEQREVYDVYLAMEPIAARQPPEASNASV